MIVVVFDISRSSMAECAKRSTWCYPKVLRKKGKICQLLKSLYGIRDANQVFATYVEEGLSNHGFERIAGGAMPVLERSAGGPTILSK